MNNSKIIAISPFASSENAGHPIIDDQFYVAYLLDRKVNFLYYTSKTSMGLILNKYPEAAGYIIPVNGYNEKGFGHFNFARQLKIPQDCKVIFFLYSENLVLIWYFLNIFKRFSLFLVSSNNVSARRVRLYPNKFFIFFTLIKKKLKAVVFDSQFQVDLVAKISKEISRRCFVRKNHLMCPQDVSENSRTCTKICISYFGPDKLEKPFYTFYSLIKSDVDKKFVYKIYNVSKEVISQYFDIDNLPSNVFFDSSWQTHETYLRNYKSSDLVMLTHTRDFEGKLSGNLCDCVALGVPYISLPIEPALSLHMRYAAPGYLYDPDKTDWANMLLAEVNGKALRQMKESMRVAAADYSVASVRKTLDQAFRIGLDQ